MLHATFSHKQLLTTHVWEFFVRLPTALDYLPGQYVSIAIPGVQDPRGISRTFTLTSLPGEEFVRFAVKFPSPCSPYKSALLELKPGDIMQISQAMGDLVLPRDAHRPLVFVAGGLGIASFVSMMRWLANHNQSRPVTLLYAAHSTEDLLYKSVIAACPGLQIRYFLSPERISTQAILAFAEDNSLIYLSGSEPFTMNLHTELLARNINPASVAYDFFDGYTPKDL